MSIVNRLLRISLNFPDFKRAVNGLFSPLVDFFYPPLCLSCRKLLLDAQRHVCHECWGSIQLVHPKLELYQETRDKLCASGTVDELVAAFVFEKEGVYQHIVHALKYSDCQSLGVELGKRVGHVMNVWGVTGDYLVPIPLHRRKLRERGYNQAELIASGMSEVTGIPVRTDLVRRKKFTQTQTMLSLEERKKNMDDAFEVVPVAIRNLENNTCILVDDVITTGSTIISCARELRAAGASRTIAASSALAE